MESTALRKIIHVDMDAFFASVEQRDNPALRGKPVAVGYAAARGVVAAASYEARVYGVRSAMPSSTALRQCPELIFAPPRFEAYKQVSAQIRAIFAAYTPLIEPLSLDEAYLDVTDNLCGLPSATVTAEHIRARVLSETGLTASAGISYNKFLAKLGSDQNKPNGQCVITPATASAFIEQLKVGRFHGVGPKTLEKMNALGIFTGADLRARNLAFLQTHFGKSGAWYYGIARGMDHRPVCPDRMRKSSGSETTYSSDLTDSAAIEAALLVQVDDVWEWCARTGSCGKTITIKAKYADFTQITRSRTLALPIVDREVMHSTARELVRSVLPTAKGIRLLGASVANFGTACGGNDNAAQFALPF